MLNLIQHLTPVRLFRCARNDGNDSEVLVKIPTPARSILYSESSGNFLKVASEAVWLSGGKVMQILFMKVGFPFKWAIQIAFS